VVPRAGYFWAREPIGEPGRFDAYAAAKILRFL
jgi:hypothetical protein